MDLKIKHILSNLGDKYKSNMLKLSSFVGLKL